MIAYFEQFVSALNRPKTYLLGANFLLVFFLILFSNAGVLPIHKFQDFIFFALLFLIFALYRPGWAFLFFVGTIALENINLAPEMLGVAIRPYQFIGSLVLAAILIRRTFNRTNFDFPKFKSIDWAIVIFALSGFLSAAFAMDEGVSLKQSAIALTFAVLYFLARIFVQNLSDLKRIAPFFLSSGMVVGAYGIWQNIRFGQGLNHFEVMPGRPNATFTEADWLGIYLVLLIAVLYAMIYYFQSACHSERAERVEESNPISLGTLLLYIILSVSYIILILTVSRSAWLGAVAVTAIFFVAVFTQLKLNPKEWQWKKTLQIKIGILISLALAIGIVYMFNLTTFQLWNRAGSTASGLQKITVSCASNVALPEKIGSVSELANYNCRHIDLENIDAEKQSGNFVKEINRPDPNVNVRARIYQKSWEVIKNNPILGIGWGNSGSFLGRDDRGVALNSSNLFLETYLGSGILGVLALVYIFVYILIQSLRGFRMGDSEQKIVSLFILLGVVALLIPNLFNAGIFLGILWVFLGIAVALL